jgi:hypothetical protein
MVIEICLHNLVSSLNQNYDLNSGTSVVWPNYQSEHIYLVLEFVRMGCNNSGLTEQRNVNTNEVGTGRHHRLR